jgi:hypothetical protein
LNSKRRAVEALGKIAAALPREQEARQRELGAVILEALNAAPRPSTATSLFFGLTAAFDRDPPTRSDNRKFLDSANPRARRCANALARCV